MELTYEDNDYLKMLGFKCFGQNNRQIKFREYKMIKR